MLFKNILVSLLLPPFGFVSLIGLGLLLGRFHRAVGRAIVGFSLAGLVLLAIPAVSDMLLDSLERGLPRTPPASAPPGAIVVLGAEIRHTAGDTSAVVGRLSLERLRTAAALQRRTGLPILVSGGIVADGLPTVAEVMARSLEDDFRVPVRWQERRSRDTWENAKFSAEMLRAAGITSVYVVTHAWHMPRALLAFRPTGLIVTAAPTPLDVPAGRIIEDYVPRASAWRVSYFALHEWIGRAWYAVR